MSDTYTQEREKYEKELQEWKENEERNWKIYHAGKSEIDSLMQRQGEECDKLDKWMMTMAAGSFGLSFAFIDTIVPVKTAHYLPFLFSAWSGFLAVLVIGVIGFIVSALVHTVHAEEESKMLPLKYAGKEPEYKKRGIFFTANAVFGYAQILLFIGGSACLMTFIAKNLM
jgi:hypothetical protein